MSATVVGILLAFMRREASGGCRTVMSTGHSLICLGVEVGRWEGDSIKVAGPQRGERVTVTRQRKMLRDIAASLGVVVK